jgi:hypothetical protein
MLLQLAQLEQPDKATRAVRVEMISIRPRVAVAVQVQPVEMERKRVLQLFKLSAVMVELVQILTQLGQRRPRLA